MKIEFSTSNAAFHAPQRKLLNIANDDELNGIHTAQYVQTIDPNKEDDVYSFELIEEDCGNVEIKGKSILIS